MSEAGLPPNQSQPEPIPELHAEPSESKPDTARLREAVRLFQVSDPWDDDWETVNFPDAIAIDELPVVTDPDDIRTPTPEPAGKVAADASQTPLIEALHRCNRDLIDRIAELEEELERCHQQLQEQDTHLGRQVREMDFAREQVTRLFRKLEVANRVIRQQQVLVESLTRQWDTGQTRMAQMERECAIAQQRYNEQFHELIDTQNACRELRSRLHRQQRHTLQLKAALERSLEMQSPNPPRDSRRATVQNPETPAEPELSPSFLFRSPTLSLSKALPVQPWSAQFSHPSGEVSEEETAAEETPREEIGTRSATPEVRGSEVRPPEEPDAPELQAIAPPEEPAVEEWPQPRFVEEELDRIRLEYAASPPANAREELAAIAPGEQVTNWPAPLIYPQRRRKLQSLSAIQLPTF